MKSHKKTHFFAEKFSVNQKQFFCNFFRFFKFFLQKPSHFNTHSCYGVCFSHIFVCPENKAFKQIYTLFIRYKIKVKYGLFTKLIFGYAVYSIYLIYSI